MKITLNGRPHELDDGSTVKQLLATIGFADRPVVVELNKDALLPREHATQILADGDLVEVVQITAGG